MPWEERTVSGMREELVARARAKEASITALCREYGISRQTGHKWIKRAQEGKDLENRSRRPKRITRIDERIEEEIVAYRERYPALGAVKIKRVMENEGHKGLPCVKTINNILHRHGMITEEASRKATPYRRFVKSMPNELWQADYLGKYALGNREWCHTLNILDDYSRYNLCCAPLHTETFQEIKPEMIRVFRENGLPRVLLCDNGNPWGTAQTTGYTLFEVWLMDHGILTIHGRPLHPQTQGKEERFNGTLRRELLKLSIPIDWEDAINKCEEYRRFYNEKRPHHALNLDTPASHYRASERQWTDKVALWEYPEGTQIRKVRGNGCFNWDGQGYFLSYAFADKEIGIRKSLIDECISLYYRQFTIARIDTKKRVYTIKRIYLTENDPRLTER